MLVTSAFLAGLSFAATPQPQPYHAAPIDETDAKVRRLRTAGVLTGGIGLAGLATTAALQVRELRASAHCTSGNATKATPGVSCFDAPPIGDRALRVGGLSVLAGSGFAAGYMLGRARGIGEAMTGRSSLSNRTPLMLVTALVVTTSGTLLLASNLGGFSSERACESDACIQKTRSMRYLTTDLAAAGLAFGLGLGGHTVGRSLELRRDAQLTLSPGASRNGASLALSGQF